MKTAIYLIAPLMLAACVSRPAPLPAAVAEDFAATPDCGAETFSIYFEEGSSSLSDQSDAVIDTVSDSYSRCDLRKMEIEGFADANGDSATNEAISAARAAAVKAALETRGVDAERVRLIAYGEMGSVTEDGEDEPLNRKAEVRLVPER
ncbi:OmpA family protein [Hyphomonas johnsonii]|jgi:OOP family OmpA-OmpF porin|uniref:Outer membrane protein n=1 Tax=Hyphomonas johnsonii MHS-2 TaxID=1280950 RepID=A0A059FNB1_9PROT|nr:OmpA family protein [Hyphomonas johnsonii]KCZ92087.1 outer membrane protein [Hyphomonas johnsonii MHS-2]